MKTKINLKIITLEGVFFSGEVTEMILPTELGQITVLPNHIPLISKVKDGKLVLRDGKSEKIHNLTSGVLEVRPNSEVYLLVDKVTSTD